MSTLSEQGYDLSPNPNERLEVFNYKATDITFEIGSGVMVNATEMGKHFSKQPSDWVRSQSSKCFIDELSSVKQIPRTELILVFQGGSRKQGTWFHEDVALEYARWLSPNFSIWCNDRIKELMRHGFTATPDKLEELVSNPDLLISLAKELKRERRAKKMLEVRTETQEGVIKELMPKGEYFDNVLQSESVYTTTTIAKEMGMSATTLNRLLKHKRVQYKIDGHWVLYHLYQNKEYTKTKTHTHTNHLGQEATSIQTVWTEKGRKFIHDLVDMWVIKA